MIETEDEYRQTLAEIDELWASKIGTMAYGRFAYLVNLVEAYENKYYPIDLPSPEKAQRFRAKQES